MPVVSDPHRYPPPDERWVVRRINKRGIISYKLPKDLRTKEDKLALRMKIINIKIIKEIMNKTMVDTVPLALVLVLDSVEIKSITKHTGSSIAKSGFKEEELICKDLNENNNGLRDKLQDLTVACPDIFKQLKGHSKVDVSNGGIKCQVKKYGGRGFGQVDRHYTSDVVKVIPGLKDIEGILISLCELPLCEEDNKKCDKSKTVVKLCEEAYSEEQLKLFIETLNKNKKELLNYVFLGANDATTPEFIIGVQYIQNERKNITIYTISDIIDILICEDFKIRKSKTVFELGGSFTFQRKGGDNGRKSANQLQCKFSFGKFRELYDKQIEKKIIIDL